MVDLKGKSIFVMTNPEMGWGPWSFSEDRLHYVVDFIFKFLIGIRYK